MIERLLCLSLIYYLILASEIECSQPPIGLKRTLVNAILPIGLAFSSTQAVFDGKDSIYVMGGVNRDYTEYCTILRYSISSNLIQCAGNLFEGSGRQGTANLGKNGKIYFSTNQGSGYYLYEFDPITNHARGVDVPINSNGFMYSAVTNSGSLILMLYESNHNTRVIEWHVNATTYRNITELPFHLWDGSVHYLPASNKILIVGSYGNSRTMALLDVETGETEILPSLFWTIRSGTTVVVNGELFKIGHAYEVTSGNFLWYDLAEKRQAMAEILNFSSRDIAFTSHTGVYVQPLNRVYIFGGHAYSVGYVRSIWYVDMPPMPDVPDIPTICNEMKVGESCDVFDCSRCGFCWGNTSYYLQCNTSSSQIIRDECDPGLWWNPSEKPQHLDIGGACDEWKNLPLEIRQQYENNTNCVTPSYCLWGQYEGDTCTNKYWHSNENGDRENLVCGGDLVWDNVKQQCRLCKNVSGCPCLPT